MLSTIYGRTLLLATIACIVLICTDYRLDSIGVLCSILAGLFTGLATHIRPRQDTHKVVDTIHISLWGLLLSGGSLLLWERISVVAIRLAAFDPLEMVWYLANVTSTAIALGTGGSVVALTDSFVIPDYYTIGLVSVVGIAGALSTQRSYTTPLQVGGFAAACYTLHLIRKACASRVGSAVECERSIACHTDTATGQHSKCTGVSSGVAVLARRSHNFAKTITCTLLVTAFITVNFRTHTQPAPPTKLDAAFQASMKVEVVISMYQESTEHVGSLISSLRSVPGLTDAFVHIYTKDTHANTSQVQLDTGAHKVTRLPNIGREGETYLQHIVTHWNSLARHTLFVQAEVHREKELLWRLTRYFRPNQTGMLDLGFRGYSLRCRGIDRWGWSDTSGLVPRLYKEIYGGVCRSFLATYKGQFLASAARIRGVDKKIYEELLAAMRDARSWAHTRPYVDGKVDEMSAPVLGYTIERIWGVLLQCSSVAAAWQCPSYESRLFSWDSSSSCQCLDDTD